MMQLSELATELDCDLGAIEVRRTQQSVVNKAGGFAAREGIDGLLDWMVEDGMVVSDDGHDWVEIVCPWAHEHTTGSNTAQYSPLGRGRGFEQYRTFNCFHEHCADRGFAEFFKVVSRKGAPFASHYDPLPWLQDRYVYVGMGQKVADMEQRLNGGQWLWELSDWTKMHPGKMRIPGADREIPVATAWLNHPGTIKTDAQVYRPVSRQADTGVVVVHDQQLLNTYVPPQWPERHDAPELFIEHMEYLVPDATERETVLNWLAYKIQNPESRSYAVVMVAKDAYGTGRSWLRAILARAIGRQHIGAASMGQLIGKGTLAEQNYNDWMVGVQFLIVEEAKDSGLTRDDFYHGYETFKQNVDTRVLENLRVNGKFQRTVYANAYFNAWIFTNNVDAIALPENDRRICVVENPEERRGKDYYEKLEASLNGAEPAKLYWWLMHRDVSQFDHVYPPMTNGKRAMIESTKAPSEVIFEWLVDNHGPDLVTKKSLRDVVRLAAQRNDYSAAVRDPSQVVRLIWQEIGSLRAEEKNGARYNIDGERVEIRAIRNKKKWTERDKRRASDVMLAELARN